jgi:hypothetical protein
LRTIKVDSDEDLPDPYVFVEDMVNDNDGFFISSSNSIYLMDLVHTYDEEVSKDTVVKYLRHYTIEDFKDNDQTVTYTITQDILKKVGGPVYEIRMESEYIKLYHSTAKISDYTHGILDDDSDVDYGYNVFSNDAYIKKYLEEFFPQMCNVLDAACNDPSATESITYTDVEVAKGIAPSNCYNVIRGALSLENDKLNFDFCVFDTNYTIDVTCLKDRIAEDYIGKDVIMGWHGSEVVFTADGIKMPVSFVAKDKGYFVLEGVSGLDCFKVYSKDDKDEVVFLPDLKGVTFFDVKENSIMKRI